MLRFLTDNFHHFLDRFAHLKGGIDAAEVVWAQLLQVKEVLYHKCQKSLSRTVTDLKFFFQWVGEFLVNALQPLFKAVRMIKALQKVLQGPFFCIDKLYKVTDLASLHFHGKILHLNRI